MLVRALIAAATDDIPTKEDLRSVDNESEFTSSSTEGWYPGEVYWSLYSLSLASTSGTALALTGFKISGDAIEEL